MKLLQIPIICSIAIATLYSCNEVEYTETKDGYTVYRVLKGGNGVQHTKESLDGSSLSFDLVLDTSAMYNGTEGLSVINKALGFSDCGSDEYINANSARFGWRWYKGKFELFAITVVDNTEFSAKLTDIAKGQSYLCGIEILADSAYRFSVDGKQYLPTKRGCDNLDTERRVMFPYFGNDTIVAPKEITILIKKR